MADSKTKEEIVEWKPWKLKFAECVSAVVKSNASEGNEEREADEDDDSPVYLDDDLESFFDQCTIIVENKLKEWAVIYVTIKYFDPEGNWYTEIEYTRSTIVTNLKPYFDYEAIETTLINKICEDPPKSMNF